MIIEFIANIPFTHVPLLRHCFVQMSLVILVGGSMEPVSLLKLKKDIFFEISVRHVLKILSAWTELNSVVPVICKCYLSYNPDNDINRLAVFI